jgi:hypothetical protein
MVGDWRIWLRRIWLGTGGRWSSGRCVETTFESAPSAVWVFWSPIWRTESLDRGLTLVCRFSLSALGSAFQLRLKPAPC